MTKALSEAEYYQLRRNWAAFASVLQSRPETSGLSNSLCEAVARAALCAIVIGMSAEPHPMGGDAAEYVTRSEYEALLAHHIKLKAQSDAAHVGLAILAKKMGISVADWKAMIAPVHEETLHHSWALLEYVDPGKAARLDTRVAEPDAPDEAA